jgi:hypothetical protein
LATEIKPQKTGNGVRCSLTQRQAYHYAIDHK